MRRLLLPVAALLLILVPSVACLFVALSPYPRRILPVGFWVLWLIVSLWAMFYAPALVYRLTSRDVASYRGNVYIRWGIVLGLINIACSVAEIAWLGRP